MVDSRQRQAGWSRRRRCKKCHYRWTTLEVHQDIAERISAAIILFDAAMDAMEGAREAFRSVGPLHDDDPED